MGTSLSRRHCGLGSKVPHFDDLYPPSGEINFWGRLYSLECAGAAFYLLGFLFCRLLTGILLGAFLWTHSKDSLCKIRARCTWCDKDLLVL